jgi:tetratricopeptide (TPR) repeat protein
LSFGLVSAGPSIVRADDGENAFNAGKIALEHGDFDTAISDFSEAIRLKPDAVVAYNNRGVAHKEKGEKDRAIDDFSKAIAINPNWPTAFDNWGEVEAMNGNFAAAIADFHETVRLDPKNAEGWNNLAWVYATASNELSRDGTLAVACARKACDLTDWKNPVSLDTLAVAYAESGNFPEAAKWERACLGYDLPKKNADALRHRLDLFKDSKAYHEQHESDWGPDHFDDSPQTLVDPRTAGK